MTRFRFQLTKRNLAIDNRLYSFLHAIQIQKACHKVNLVNSGFKEKFAKVQQSRLGQISPAIQISSTGLVCPCQGGKILFPVSCETSGNSPQPVAIYFCLFQIGMSHKSCNPPIAIQKRMNPCKTVMRGRSSDNLSQTSHFSRVVGFFESFHKSAQVF